MGVCNLSKNEHKNNIYITRKNVEVKKESNERKQSVNQYKKNIDYKTNIKVKKESNEIKKTVNENCTNHATKIPLNIINQVSKSICKITYKINEDIIQGTGFFMIINDNKYLLTNYHVINKDLIDKIINIEINNNKKIEMKINDRDIKFYEYLDITIIEMKESDNIIKDIDFLDYDLNYIKGYEQYRNIDIFSLQYTKKGIEVASGKIIDIINNYEFEHSIDIEYGSSGSPIIILNKLKVIGIHKQGDKYKSINYGSFIGEILKNNILNKKESNNNNTIDNYIIGEIYISEENIGKEIRIINSYEEKYREYKYNKEEEYRNEKEIKECIIEINDIKYSFSYFHKFENSGKYKIKYIFKNLITNCNHMFFKCSSLTNLNLLNYNT
jgi:V8-like Glu-specific endopeptidase